ncbi:MAG: arsenate reductase ArsC [Rhizomicrobium sp.]
MEDRKPGSVLFLCTMNAVRSPMAAGLLGQLKGSEIRVESAGLHAGPVDPLAAQVMAEIGIPLLGHRPRSFEALGDVPFDLTVALSAEAKNQLRGRGKDGRIEYWRTLDPTQVEGSDEQRRAAYRALRDALGRKIGDYFV